jgi:hypothetical protein
MRVLKIILALFCVWSVVDFTAASPGGRCRRFLLTQCLFLLSILPFVVGGALAAPGASVRNAPVTAAGPGPLFTIADFDGDHHPDLANVQVGRIDSSLTDYSIQLQLTAYGRRSIQLVAPSGGLLIEARDVNGDHAVDLVLATAWVRQPVAILLNDGHGDFSLVGPTVFPGAFSDSTVRPSESDQATEAVGTPPQSSSIVCLETKGVSGFCPHADPISPSRSGFLFGSSRIRRAGRAPPSKSPQS